jgi:hypothetical protein
VYRDERRRVARDDPQACSDEPRIGVRRCGVEQQPTGQRQDAGALFEEAGRAVARQRDGGYAGGGERQPGSDAERIHTGYVFRERAAGDRLRVVFSDCDHLEPIEQLGQRRRMRGGWSREQCVAASRRESCQGGDPDGRFGGGIASGHHGLAAAMSRAPLHGILRVAVGAPERAGEDASLLDPVRQENQSEIRTAPRTGKDVRQQDVQAFAGRACGRMTSSETLPT